jgi:hypothetical protein
VAHGTFLRCVALGTSLIMYVYGDLSLYWANRAFVESTTLGTTYMAYVCMHLRL